MRDISEVLLPNSLAYILERKKVKQHRRTFRHAALGFTEKISTGLRSLDRAMKGGIGVGSLTGFIGAFGSGKSQLCHQLAVMVQLPVEEGGLASGAVYVDTEGDFRPERLAAMAEYRGLDPQHALENTIYIRTHDWKELVHVIRESSSKLIIVDSLSWLFRGAESKKEAYRVRSIMYSILALALEWTVKNEGIFIFSSHGYKQKSFGDPYVSLFALVRLWTARNRDKVQTTCWGREINAVITEGGIIDED